MRTILGSAEPAPRLSNASLTGLFASIFLTWCFGRRRLAEATVYVASTRAGRHRNSSTSSPTNLPPATRSGAQRKRAPLVGYPLGQSPIVRIVDPETQTECRDGTTGEIWVHGENVDMGYCRKPQELSALAEPSRRRPTHLKGLGSGSVTWASSAMASCSSRPHQGSLLRSGATPMRMCCTTSPSSSVKSPRRSQTHMSRGSGSSTTQFDSHRHKRQDQEIGLCRAVPAESVRPLGRLNINRANGSRLPVSRASPVHVGCSGSASAFNQIIQLV